MAKMNFSQVCETGQWLLCSIIAGVPDDAWDHPAHITVNGVEIGNIEEWANEHGKRIDDAVDERANAIAQDKIRDFEDTLDFLAQDIRCSVKKMLETKHGITFQEEEHW